MSKSQRKVDTASFTSALKQVFHIHKNVVSELCAQLDVLSDECKLLKANPHTPGRPGTCESCVNLEKMNRNQQEHFNHLLHKKNMDMKKLEEKLQSLAANTENVTRQDDKILPPKMSHFLAKEAIKRQEFLSEDIDIIQLPQHSCKGDVALPPETCSAGKSGDLHEANLHKGHTRLSLTRQSKRHSHHAEDQRQAKRLKMSLSAKERDQYGSVHKVDAEGHNDGVYFVPDTDYSSQQRRKLLKPQLGNNLSNNSKVNEAEGDNDQSEQILVIPETLAVDISSYSDNESDRNNLHDRNSSNQNETFSDSRKNYTNVDDNFLDNLSDKIDRNNMRSVTANSIKDCSVPRHKEDSYDVSNNCGDIKSMSVKDRPSESEKSCLSKPARRILFQGEEIVDGSARHPNVHKESDLTGKAYRKQMLQKSMNVIDIEASPEISDSMLMVEGEPLKNEIRAANTCDGGSPNFLEHKVTEGSVIPRKINSVRKKSDHEKQENISSHAKDYSIDHCVERKCDNLPPSVKSVRQTTLIQEKDVQMSKIKLQNDQNVLNLSDLQKCQMAQAIHRPENNSPRKLKNVRIDLEILQILHHSSELGMVQSKHRLMNNRRKEIVTNRLGDSLVNAHLLSLTSELKSSGQGETTRISSELNGSLNPNIHLSEYLHSEMVTEKQSQVLGNLDETIAPNLISQYISSQNIKKNNLTNQSLGTVTSNEKCETFQTVETYTNDNSANSQPPSPVNVIGTPSKGLQEKQRHSQNESNLNTKDEWCDIEDDDDANIFTSVEDEPETIEPSPQHVQNGSQLRGSLPSISCSFKFIHKQPQLASNSVVRLTSKHPPKINNHFMNKENPVMDVSKGSLTDNLSLDFGDKTVLKENEGPPLQSLLDSFDRIPKTEVTEFPHISVVRKKSEREKLEGFACKQCHEYYKNSGLSEEAMKQKKNECSRHRERYRAPDTPEHFWSLGIPDTAEMLERRQKYNSKESPVAANRAPRRRRRLEQKF